MANFDNFDNYEQFEKDINSWTKLGIVIKTHKVKAYCKQCKKWTWVVQRKSYSGFVCQCTCGTIHAIKITYNSPTVTDGFPTWTLCHQEKHFNDIQELGKYFNLEYFD